MSEWRTFVTEKLIMEGKLFIGDGYRAKNSELSDQGLPFARAGNINNGFQFEACDRFPSEEIGKLGNKISETNDVVFTSKGTVGRFAFVRQDTPTFVFSPQLCFWRVLDKSVIFPRYLYYWMYSHEFWEQVSSLKDQTDMADYVNLTDQRKMTISLPPLPEQKAIAGVLSNLDDKIDLLHRQNKTLEALAETLFRQWFVEEAQDDWEEKKVSDMAEHVKVNVKPSSDPTSIFHHYSIPAYDEGKMPKQEYGSEILSNKYEVFPNTIMVSKLNPRFPRIWAISNQIETNSICSTEFQIFKPKLDVYYPFLYFLFKSDEAMAEMEMAASGTSGSHQRVKPNDMLNISFVIPSNEKVEEFSNCTLPLLHKKERNKNQIVILEKLRDTLLPKLMSGEVRVSEL